MIGRNRLLQVAVASLIHRAETQPPAPVYPKYDLRAHAELHKLSGLTIQPVPAGHDKAPEPKKFNVEGAILYVLDTDWPALKQALERQRGG